MRTKHAHDFTAADRAVIRERLRYEQAAVLALVFGTSTRVINNIARYT